MKGSGSKASRRLYGIFTGQDIPGRWKQWSFHLLNNPERQVDPYVSDGRYYEAQQQQQQQQQYNQDYNRAAPPPPFPPPSGPIYEPFTTAFAERARGIRVGNGLDPSTEMGPVANVRRVEALDALVSDARAKGARLLAGGERSRNRGYFFPLTVLAVLSDGADTSREPAAAITSGIRFTRAGAGTSL